MEFWLFGSVAAGEEPPSDIDVALIHPDGVDPCELAASILSVHPDAKIDFFPHYDRQHEPPHRGEPPFHWLVISDSDFKSEHPLAESVKSGRRIDII